MFTNSGLKKDRELRRTSYAGETVATEEVPGEALLVCSVLTTDSLLNITN